MDREQMEEAEKYAPPVNPTRPFAAEAAEAFLYPLTVRGIPAILASAFVVTLCLTAISGLPKGAYRARWLLFGVLFIAASYLLTYLKDVVLESTVGERRMPDWPTRDSFSGGLTELLLLCAPLIVCLLLPALVLTGLGWFPRVSVHPAAGWALLAAGLLYFPMALLALLLLRTPLAMSPHVVAPAIRRAPAGVIFSAGTLLAAIQGWQCIDSHVSAWAAESDRFIAPIAGHFAANAAAVYLLFVAARVIGISYWSHRFELAWFENP